MNPLEQFLVAQRFAGEVDGALFHRDGNRNISVPGDEDDRKMGACSKTGGVESLSGGNFREDQARKRL